MKKAILFNTEMVQAILEDKKTTTRRIIKRTPSNDEPSGYGFWKEYNERDKRWYIKDYTHGCIWWTLEEYIEKFSKYHVGDIIYVRETWAVCEALKLCAPNKCNIEHQVKEKLVWYKADGEQPNNCKTAGEHLIGRGKWRPSIHMPKEAARIHLKVKDVRIERLNAMEHDDFLKEGIRTFTKDNTVFKYAVNDTQYPWMNMPRNPQEPFKLLWDSTIDKKQFDMYKWDSNPWVWVIEFEKV